MSKDILTGLGAGALSALLYLAIQQASPGTFILAYLSPLPLYLAGLALGLAPVVVAGLMGTVLAFAVGSWPDGLSFALLNAAPAMWISRLALLARADQSGKMEWYPAERLVTWLSTVAGIYFLIALALTSMLDGGLWSGLEAYMRSMAEQFTSPDGRNLTPETQEVIANFAQFMPAMVGISWMTMQVVNGTLAQGLAVRFKRNLRPSPSLADFRAPAPLVYALAALTAASFVPGTIGLIAGTLAVFTAYPFLFAGLGVVHALAARLASRNIVLVVFYFLLFMLGWPFLLVAGLGLIDQWADLRGRFSGTRNGPDNGPDDGQEVK